MFRTDDTIAAPATAAGGALALIRVSGPQAITICDRCFKSPVLKRLSEQKGYTIHFGDIYDCDGKFIDQVLITVFRAPASYTGEDIAEISCHGSRWIVSEIMRTLSGYGARTAEAGEFTVRAFLAGKIDLAQAEAVADMIASGNRASHELAASQLRGSYSQALADLRNQLLETASLLELELDFSEEDVTFADRNRLQTLLYDILSEIDRLLNSFSLGNALKEGVPVAIVGQPNVGKSTLLNRLAGEERAMVSDIAGTTRDSIEETVTIEGVGFRFIDTAGLHESDDTLERMGMERTYKILSQARIILYMVDASNYSPVDIANEIAELKIDATKQQFAVVVNKCDDEERYDSEDSPFGEKSPLIRISAKFGNNVEAIFRFLSSCIDTSTLYGGDAIVSNTRHYEALNRASQALAAAIDALTSGTPSDLVAEELRMVLDALGTITGQITTTEILTEIFSKFCIGK